MMLLEEQIELARELMNKKAKEVQKQKLPSIIKNPKDVEYGIPNKGNRNIPEVKEVEEVRNAQAQQVESIRNPEEVEDGIPNEVNIPQVQEVRNIQVQKIPQAVQIPQVQQVKRFQRYSIKVNNPPVLIFTNGLGIRMCTGYNNDITREQKKYPSNMVFQKKALVVFYNPKQNQMNIKDQNIHFHLNMQCLRQDDRTTEYRHLTTNDEIFKQLSLEQMEVLQKLDFL